MEDMAHLERKELPNTHENQKRRIRRMEKMYLVWKGRLLRRVPRELRDIHTVEQLVVIIYALHDEMGHWTLEASKTFVLSRFWSTGINKDMHQYV